MSLSPIDPEESSEIVEQEKSEWIESLDYVIKHGGSARVKKLLRALQQRAAEFGIHLPYSANTSYINTIPRHEQPRFPGNHGIEQRIRSILRWNAMAMVTRANRLEDGIGGHISSYASCCTLYEVGFNHFFKGKDHPDGADQIYFQGHAAPGIYSRAFLEGRLTEQDLVNFRRENSPGGGLSSYPHPYLMPEFWEYPTVSMGLGPLMAIYQARFNRYLEDRGLRKKTGHVWCFMGDGESDEPESLGAISLAPREKLDNLTFVINCNLQRLDGPVRGNYKIIQELEAIFRGAGWNVIKLIWGGGWDSLLEKDEGHLVARMEEAVDGDYQKYSTSNGKYIREHFFGSSPELKRLVDNITDGDIMKLNRGGHDPEKVYAAYKSALEYKSGPTVILAKTVKGYGLGEAGEGKNITHQQKKLNEEEIIKFRSRFNIPISDEHVRDAPFYKPEEESMEMKYLKKKRQKLGGSIPMRLVEAPPLEMPDESNFADSMAGTNDREVSTTMVAVRILTKLLRDKKVGKNIVPIIPDEARTFGMEALFRQVGIYSHIGQKYEPVDRDTLLYYHEAKDGQIIEEGITEAGSLASFIAAGTSYSAHKINMIPYLMFYSMFGFQRVGDLIWAAGDMGCRGFIFGATAGKTTLAGEGLQHQDGHSLLLAYPGPHIRAFDPAFSYELAIIIEDGIRQMYVEQKNVVYYITVGNESYRMPAVPKITDLKKQILSGLYLYQPAKKSDSKPVVDLLGSGPLLPETILAAEILSSDYGINSNIWSVPGYKQLHYDLIETQRYNMTHPDQKKKSRVEECLDDSGSAVVAVSDYNRALPYSISPSIKKPFYILGTDGFGKSESRAELRNYFEVDKRYIVIAALAGLHETGAVTLDQIKKAIVELKLDPDKVNPVISHWS